ncbi:MAG: hypothetical protein WBP59_14665 [Ilumatobacteraceae bacterium]
MPGESEVRLSPTQATAAYSLAVGADHHVVGPLVGGETGATEIRSTCWPSIVLGWGS